MHFIDKESTSCEFGARGWTGSKCRCNMIIYVDNSSRMLGWRRKLAFGSHSGFAVCWISFDIQSRPRSGRRVRMGYPALDPANVGPSARILETNCNISKGSLLIVWLTRHPWTTYSKCNPYTPSCRCVNSRTSELDTVTLAVIGMHTRYNLYVRCWV